MQRIYPLDMKMAFPLYLIFIVFSLLSLASPANGAENCFTRADSNSLKFEIFQQAPPPAYNDHKKDYPDSSPFYPVTSYASGNAESLGTLSGKSSSGFHFGKQYFLWGNRCIFMKGITPSAEDCRNVKIFKGNYYSNIIKHTDGKQLRPAFSSYERANRCTILQAERMLGQSRAELSKKSKGLILWDNADQIPLASLAKSAVLSNGTKGNYLLDVCILESTPMASDAIGIFIDWEVQDFRTASEALAFFKELKGVVATKGKELNIFTNDLTTGGPKNGLDSTNIRQIIDLVSGFAPVVWSGATAGKQEVNLKPFPRRWSFIEGWERQFNLITNSGNLPLSKEEKKKIILATSIFDMKLDEAKVLNGEVMKNQYRGFVFWRNFAKLGGDCKRPENRVVACLALGRCGEL